MLWPTQTPRLQQYLSRPSGSLMRLAQCEFVSSFPLHREQNTFSLMRMIHVQILGIVTCSKVVYDCENKLSCVKSIKSHRIMQL